MPVSEKHLDDSFRGKAPAEHLTTLAVVHTDNNVLLGRKKRKLGAGLWNGFGGKVEAGESILAAAKREFTEESGCYWRIGHYAGALDIRYEDWGQRVVVHVFSVTAIQGKPRETEEMRPRWFAVDAIPYHAMWPDDFHWLPLLLKRTCFQARILYRRGNVAEPAVTLTEHDRLLLPS